MIERLKWLAIYILIVVACVVAMVGVLAGGTWIVLTVWEVMK